MMPLFPARRRAERFDSLVEGRVEGRPGTEADPLDAELMELVSALRSAPEAAARPEFVTDLRHQLMVAARSELVAPAAGSRDDISTRLTVTPRRTRRERRVSVALGAVAIIGATTSMAVASQSALPGDALYPVKRAIENTETGFSVGDDAKGQTILGNASGRLDEVDELTHRSDPDATLIGQTLDTFSDQATEAGDLLLSDHEHGGNDASVVALQDFTEQSMDVLAGLEESIPAGAEPALLNAARTLFTIDAAADQVCPDCGAGIIDIPPQLVAGSTQALDDASQTLADGQLPGSVAPFAGPSISPDGADDGKPSGLHPPHSPVAVPPVTVDPDDTAGAPTDTTGGAIDGATDGVGVPLPSAGTTTSGGTLGTGHGGKGKPNLTIPTPPVDVTPVTDAVTDAVDGVVDGVTGLLNNLAGQTLLPGAQPTP
jgi:uncharacterized protein DUF5667